MSKTLSKLSQRGGRTPDRYAENERSKKRGVASARNFLRELRVERPGLDELTAELSVAACKGERACRQVVYIFQLLQRGHDDDLHVLARETFERSQIGFRPHRVRLDADQPCQAMALLASLIASGRA